VTVRRPEDVVQSVAIHVDEPDVFVPPALQPLQVSSSDIVEALRAQLATADSTSAALQSRVHDLQAQVHKLQQMLLQSEEDEAQLRDFLANSVPKADYRRLQDEVAQIKRSEQAALARTVELQSLCERLQESAAQTSSQASTELTSLKSAYISLQRSFEKLQNEFRSSMEREQGLEANLTQLPALQSANETLETECSRLQRELQAALRREEELRQQCALDKRTLSNKLAEAQETVETLRQALDTVSTSDQEVKSKYDLLVHDNASLRKTVSELNEVCASWLWVLLYGFSVLSCRLREKCDTQELDFVAKRNHELGAELDVVNQRAAACANDARDAKQELLRQASVWEAREVHLVSRLGELERVSQQQSSMDAELAAARADLRIRDQDVDRLSRSLANLQQVLDQFQADRDGDMKRSEDTIKRLSAQVEVLTKQCGDQYERGRADGVAEFASVKEAASTLPRVQAELAKTKQALQEQLHRVASLTDSEMLDRRVIRKLLVTYFTRPQSSTEVLKLISSMLVCVLAIAIPVHAGPACAHSAGLTPQGFSEDDKIAVGLKKRPPLSAMIFGSPQPTGDALNASLTDAWVQFLMEEVSPSNGTCVCVEPL
jgi:chromosome segregation ATPase